MCRDGQQAVVFQAPRQRQRLGAKRLGVGAMDELGEHGVLVKRRGGRALVSEQPIGANGVADMAQEAVWVAEAQRQSGAREQRLDAQRRLLGRRGQRRLQPAVALGEEPSIQPEPPQPRRQPQRRLGIAAQGPGKTGAQVVVLALEHQQRAPRAGRQRVVLLGERETPIEMAQPDRVALGGRLEPLGGVLAHGVQQTEALALRDDERLLDQPGEQTRRPAAGRSHRRRRPPRPPRA